MDLKAAVKQARNECGEETYREFYLALRTRILSDVAAWNAGWEAIFDDVRAGFDCPNCEIPFEPDTELAAYYEAWCGVVDDTGSNNLYGPNYASQFSDFEDDVNIIGQDTLDAYEDRVICINTGDWTNDYPVCTP